mmetsp:Transcript_60058/g.130263  ORF Transcript_60058/g.130263 Transcript_60058/m.130263 type:complete len:82 (-) Transcript_60058:211-456(-)|eukprot:CAMPEP_0170616932 /NCGR_PEP_ID=MMETSP0224-20130122/26136_1 /TAXON_ID=285029 /ORGANISM="Togula jolla, Strain CCCM 725" /LENGTH=81 /DNA_ID=CAMNT_0010942767 /DNA_START=61 /DNA_END=306 /DNA_ORIENTATION=-
MVLGVPLRQYCWSLVCTFGSMALGSACVHAYMKPELSSNETDFERQAAARRKAIEEVQRVAYDDRFNRPPPSGSGSAWRQE